MYECRRNPKPRKTKEFISTLHKALALGVTFFDTAPIELTIETLSLLVKEGKVRFIGLCGTTPKLLQKAHSIHPIATLEVEWSAQELKGFESEFLLRHQIDVKSSTFSERIQPR